jgi:hypothetical protein
MLLPLVAIMKLMQAIDQAAYEVEQGKGLCLLCPAKFSSAFDVGKFIVLTSAYVGPNVQRTGVVHYLCKNCSGVAMAAIHEGLRRSIGLVGDINVATIGEIGTA